MRKRKIHTDKTGREYIKESYFVNGKMKFHRVYVVDGMPADEFYERNASDIDHLINGDYWLISSEQDCNGFIADELYPAGKESIHGCMEQDNQKESDDYCEESNKPEAGGHDNEGDDLPF